MGTNIQIVYIKNMVCSRCKNKVMQIFESLGYQCITVKWGQVVIKTHHIPSKKLIDESLKEHGFELLVSEEERQAERIKILLICLLYHNPKITLPKSISKYLEMKMQKRFEELNDLFLSITLCIIQEYFNLLRFERAKELISYKDQSPEEIARQLGYKKKNYLEKEFEKKLNVSISEFRKNPSYHRTPLDQLIIK